MSESEVVWIGGPRRPVSIIGDWLWVNYSVSADVQLPTSKINLLKSFNSAALPYVAVGGRVNSSGIGVNGNNPDSGYFLSLDANATWTVSREEAGEKPLQLASGRLTSAQNDATSQVLGAWYSLTVSFEGPNISAYINGQLLITVIDGEPRKAYHNGWAALACGWNTCNFASLSLKAA